jgi:Tripartite tricarboxylate transporter TctB family
MDDSADLLPHEQPAPPRTDLWIALAFFVLGAAIAGLALAMPTYANQKGEIYTAPGLVPGLYGVVMVVLGIWLGVRAIRQGALQAQADKQTAANTVASVDRKLVLAAGLCLVFVVILLGRMPFWLASAIFVAVFTTIFEWEAGRPWQVRARRIGEAVVLGLATGAAITLVFEKVFYVRLP